MTLSDSQPGSLVVRKPDEPDRRLWHRWQRGERPHVWNFLKDAGSLTASQVAAVLAVDQWERWQIGERVPAEAYLDQHPALPAEAEEAIELIYGEYLLREQFGEKPDLAEFQRRFPQFSEALWRQVELHRELDLHSHNPAKVGRTPAAAPAPASSGRLEVPGYDLLRELGRGGMGVVYLARQQSLERLVALKVIRGEDLHRPEALARLRQEAQLIARLSHPQIVNIYDAGLVGESFFIAMEYVQGVDLHRWVTQRGPLPLDAAWACLHQTALALQQLHQRGLVHRDLKPANLMVQLWSEAVAPSEEQAWPANLPDPLPLKLLDLGLARMKARHEPSRSGQLTCEGMFLGTPDFVAPEQAEAPQSADIRADLYSLGCSLYFLLTGQVPFPNRSAVAKLVAHRSEKPAPVASLRPDVPLDLQGLLCKLLEKEPAHRFQDPTELLAALQRARWRQDPPATSLEQALTPAAAKSGTPQSPGTPATARPLAPAPGARAANDSVHWTAHEDWVKCVALSPCQRLVVSGSLDRSLVLWDLASRQTAARFQGHTAGVLAAAFSPDGRTIYSGSMDGTIRAWDVVSGAEQFCLRGHGDHVNALAVDASGRWLLTGGHDGTLRLWDLPRAELHSCLLSQPAVLWAVAFAGDGTHALAAGNGRCIHVCSLQAGRQTRLLGEGGVPVQGLTTAGPLALTASVDGVLRLYEWATGVERPGLVGHHGRATCVCLTADGRFALSGSRDATVRWWDVAAGRELACLQGHNNWITALALAPDGHLAVSASADRSLRLWQLPSPRVE